MDIAVFDPAYYPYGLAEYRFGQDANLSQPADGVGSFRTQYSLYNTHGSPDNPGKHDLMKSIIVEGFDSRQGQDNRQGWVVLDTIDNSRFKDDGMLLRLEVQTRIDDGHGINSFTIGAFVNGGGLAKHYVCDSRDSSQEGWCPRVYGRGAMSVYNNLDAANASGDISFFLADIGPEYIGQTFGIFLWDPGEGVKDIQLLAPDDTELKFDWETKEEAGPQWTGNNEKKVDTSGTAPPRVPGALSNKYKFNDRLLMISLTIPPNYDTMTTAKSNWIKIKYNVGSTPTDRTTWGLVAAAEGGGGPIVPGRLVPLR